jgi:cell division septum initiation protein DivIVA
MSEKANIGASRQDRDPSVDGHADVKPSVSSSALGIASDAANMARQAASDTASTITKEAKQLLDKQVGRGSELVGNLGSSVKAAARELDGTAPQLAGMAHALASRVDSFARDLDGQSIDQLARRASAMTRRQPALVFGLTALAGFLVLRTFRAAPASTPDRDGPRDSSIQRGDSNQYRSPTQYGEHNY